MVYYFYSDSQEVIIISSIAGTAFAVESYQDFMAKGIPFATSRAWQLGRGVIRALRMNKSPVEEILQLEEGSVLIIAGEVCYEEIFSLRHARVKYDRNAHQ